jgi:predicted nucleic acid-binding protein
MVFILATIFNGFPPGKPFAFFRPERRCRPKTAMPSFVCSIKPLNVIAGALAYLNLTGIEVGRERNFTIVAALVDTNLLVYRFDSRFPQKQKVAIDILRRGIEDDSIRVPHQAILEFVAAVTRPIRGYSILKQSDALREAEEFIAQFTVVYPNEAILRNAIRGCAAYQLNWFDAQIWSYAEYYGLTEILTEDLQHDRLYGTVRAVNPFRNAEV